MKPRVVVSACLGFEACRYDGARLSSAFLRRLAPHVVLQRVCPEVAIGLGTPRDPIRVLPSTRGRRLIQPATGRDLTSEMDGFAVTYLKRLPAVDGFVLKSRSPSCGVRDGRAGGRGPGLFAEAVQTRLPDLAVEDERRLEDPRRREHFLARIFTTAAFRTARGRDARVAFHDRHQRLFHAWNQTKARSLDRLVGARDPYKTELRTLLTRLPPRTAREVLRVHLLPCIGAEAL